MDDFDRALEKPDLPVSNAPELVTDSVTLARLLEEVRNGSLPAPGAYNRVHNRHNR